MEIFKFDKEELTRYIEYELRTVDNFKEPFNYVVNGLKKLKHSIEFKSLDKIDFNKIKEKEGKDYHWSTFSFENATLLVRRYKNHFTIFTKVITPREEELGTKVEYGAFTFRTDFEKFGEQHDEMMDEYWDKPFTDLNAIGKDLFTVLLDKTYGVHWVSNSACLKVPKHVEIKLIFRENSIYSLDDFAFCMEEISDAYLMMFSENTMIQKLKELNPGEMLDTRYRIEKIVTEVKNGYYHSVGLSLNDTLSKDNKSFQDVYSLTRYYFDSLFKEEIYFYQGDIYIKGVEFKEGEPVVSVKYKYGVTIFKETYPKENFIPLKKY